MAKYDLDLRMGIDSKLQSAELNTGALSYAIDTQNLYVDALKQNKEAVERQMINADKAYALRDQNEQIVAKTGIGDLSFITGLNTSAIGIASQAFGKETIADSDSCLTIGEFNASDDNALFIVGNGKSNDNRSNAFIVNKDGAIKILNSLNIGNMLEVPQISYEGTSVNLNYPNVNNHLVIDPGLIVQGNLQSENANILNTLISKYLNVNMDLVVSNNIHTNGLIVDSASQFNDSINISNNVYATNLYKLDKETKEYKEIASENFVENRLEETKDEIMEDVQEIADSIITDVWYRSSTPPTTVKQAKLLWIRYDGTSTYGNGVLYYFNPTLLNENLTDAQVALEDNWIPMSAIYT